MGQQQILQTILEKYIELGIEVSIKLQETYKGKLIKYTETFGLSTHSLLEFRTQDIKHIDLDTDTITLDFRKGSKR